MPYLPRLTTLLDDSLHKISAKYTKATSILKKSAKNFSLVYGVVSKAGSSSVATYFLKYIQNPKDLNIPNLIQDLKFLKNKNLVDEPEFTSGKATKSPQPN